MIDPNEGGGGAPRGRSGRLMRWVLGGLRGSAPGASMVEYLIVVGVVALVGLAAFNRFGRTLHLSMLKEARHIRGEALPNAGNLLDSLGGLTDPDGLCELVPGGGRLCVQSSGNCFVAGTPVAAERGPRAIESLQAGDEVWSRNVETGEERLRRVLTTFRRTKAAVIEVELALGGLLPERLGVTPGHRFWSPKNGWVRADVLADEPLLSAQGDWVAATALASLRQYTTVYNLEVEEFHTYFVGRSRTLVHNQNTRPGPLDCPELPELPAFGAPQFPSLDIERCKRAHRSVNGPLTNGTQRSSRPADAETRLCIAKLTECQHAEDKEACDKKWECIDEHIASHPTSGYFDSESTAAGIRRKCSSKQADVRACHQGSRRGVALSPEQRSAIADAARERALAKAQGNAQAQREAAEAAGKAAAKAHADAAYPDWNCTYAEGTGVFDGVCVGPEGQVALIEAKGGTSSLGSRWSVDGRKRVQQGTREYVLSMIAALRKSGDESKIRQARDIERALAAGAVTYEHVEQRFDGDGNPLAPTVRGFELDPARCPSGSNR